MVEARAVPEVVPAVVRSDAMVDRYVTTDQPMRQLLRAVPAPRTPLVQSLIYIEECLDGKRLARDAIDTARLVPIKGTDPELLVLMLSRWAELSCRIGRPTEAEALVSRATALVSEEAHPEIRAAALHVQGILADTTGNKTRREQLLKEILLLLPDHSPRRKFYLLEIALFLAQQGRGVESQELIRDLTWRCNEQLPLAAVRFVQFVDAVETGRAKDAARMTAELDAAPQAYRGRDLLVMYRGYRALLGLMQGERTPPGAADAAGPRELVSAQVVRALLDGKTAEALRLARMDANRLLGSIFATGFDSLNLIRAELATGTAEGALRLLNMRRSRGNQHYLDEVFLARARRIEGNHAAAARHFAAALEAAARYDARQRLDFELRLACELGPADVEELARDAERVARRADPYAAAEADEEVTPEEPVLPQQGVGAILGRSAAMGEVRLTVTRFADLDAPILITGETGTGKDLVARILHETSSRRPHPFIPVNCASITETLLESEMFGHERGAFTGAEKASKGLFEEAGSGTILLDEIGDISARLQQTLLRVLETGEIRAVGSAKTRQIHCRILAATNADLAALVETRRFRRDLLFRLQRLEIHIPPLRERREDIPVLARHFLDVGRRGGLHAALSADLQEMLRAYDWPGNVRELRNVIERMRLLHSDKLAYTPQDLDLKFRAAPAARRLAGDAPARAPADAGPSPAMAPPHAATSDADKPASDILRAGRSPMRRLDRLRELFRLHDKLTRAEAVQILGVSPNTASKYLQALCDEGLVERVEPSASTRSHYFTLRKQTAPQKPAGEAA